MEAGKGESRDHFEGSVLDGELLEAGQTAERECANRRHVAFVQRKNCEVTEAVEGICLDHLQVAPGDGQRSHLFRQAFQGDASETASVA